MGDICPLYSYLYVLGTSSGHCCSTQHFFWCLFDPRDRYWPVLSFYWCAQIPTDTGISPSYSDQLVSSADEYHHLCHSFGCQPSKCSSRQEVNFCHLHWSLDHWHTYRFKIQPLY